MRDTRGLIRRMTPEGTRGDRRWEMPPIWPPDLFAVAATLVDRSSAYRHLLNPHHAAYRLTRPEAHHRVRTVAKAWRSNAWLPQKLYRNERKVLQRLWRKVLAGAEDVGEDVWVCAALELMMIADEASAGLGFYPEPSADDGWNWIDYVFLKFERLQGDSADAGDDGDGAFMRQKERITVCQFVPPEVACVLPKTRTPDVGCTLRSVSHNLALLPAKDVVEAVWNVFPDDQGENHHVFNILVVPYPYRVSGRCFRGHKPEGDGYGMFSVEQNWLEDSGGELPEFIVGLVNKAREDVNHVDSIVLPELALDESKHRRLIVRLRKETRERPDFIHFLVSGIQEKNSEQAGTVLNTAVTTVFAAGRGDGEGQGNIAALAGQPKHHRWKLDRNQIVQYSLGDALDPRRDWWESIPIERRLMPFYVFRQDASFTTLVCEDLARSDPGQQTIRAVGPNLVIALLMDGPQLSTRWSGRYALNLADDPGCSVLSVTSLGLVTRSNHYHGQRRRVIGLWRDSRTGTRELELPEGAQAVVLSLTRHDVREHTIDGRTKVDDSFEWTLSGMLPVFADDPPDWAKA